MGEREADAVATRLWYSAKDAYLDHSAAAEYERRRFSGPTGRYRRLRETRAIRSLVELMPEGATVLDCPCGTGRWWPTLSRRASTITGVDISQAMLRYAGERAAASGLSVTLHEADAAVLPFKDASVDFVFSHALTKHLPWPLQSHVLNEFSRVARLGVICSFGVFNHFTYEVWRRRHLIESYPMFPEELDWMANHAGLQILDLKRCTSPVGVEHSVSFRKP